MKALKVGQALELEVENTRPPVTVKALVQTYELGECLLSLPDVPAAPAELAPDAVVSIRFCTPEGFHQARSTVIEVRPGRPPEVLLDDLRGESSAQRRSFFRTGAHLPAEISLLHSSLKTAKLGSADRQAVTVDISGGGIKLETRLVLSLEDRVGIVVRVPQKLQPALPAVLVAEARVLRIQEVIRRGEDRYQVAASFLMRREVDRDPWVKLTLDIERGLDREQAPPLKRDDPEAK